VCSGGTEKRTVMYLCVKWWDRKVNRHVFMCVVAGQKSDRSGTEK
jgi:hypothetical protein